MRADHKLSHPFRFHRYSLRHVSALPALAMNRLLASAAASFVGLFLPIFLYEFFGLSIQWVLLWFAIDFFVKIPLFVPAAKIFSKIGLIRSMVIGSGGAAIFYFAFYLLDVNVPYSPFLLHALAIGGLAILSAFYWSPFHVDLAEFTTKGKRGRQLGVFNAAQQLIGVLAPVVAGFTIVTFGFSATFFFAFILLGLSVLPLFSLPHTKVNFEFGYWETFQKMFSKRFRNMTFSMMSYGAENITGTVVWPIFLFVIFDGDYLNIGVFATVIVVISLALEFLMGREVDRKPVNKLLEWGTGVYALGWVAKAFVDTVVGVFAASTFHSLGSILVRAPMEAMMYEQAADSGHYIDEYTTIREIALSFGRVLMMLILILVTTWFSIPAAFLIAALVSLGINLLARRTA